MEKSADLFTGLYVKSLVTLPEIVFRRSPAFASGPGALAAVSLWWTARHWFRPEISSTV